MGAFVEKIVHDRQSQFEGTLAEWHLMFSNASDEPIKLPGESVVLQKAAGSSFVVSSSSDSPGIQVIDLVLWLFRQLISGKTIPKASADILIYAFNKGYCSDFSFRGVGEKVQQQWSSIMAADISPEAMAAGQRILAETEKRRQKQIALYEEDGLMPYKRRQSREASLSDG